MPRRLAMLTALTVILLAFPAPAGPKPTAGEFQELSIVLETNETDQDGEIVIVAKAFEGMDRFSVTDPTGRKLADWGPKGREDIGLAQVRLESAEPSLQQVKEAYPEGVYRFHARTVSGGRLSGTATLTHALLPAPVFTPDDEDVEVDAAVIRWAPVAGAAAFIIEIVQDDLGVELTVILPPDAVSFAIPPGFLMVGEEYEIGVATLTPEGNLSVAESSFTVAGGE